MIERICWGKSRPTAADRVKVGVNGNTATLTVSDGAVSIGSGATADPLNSSDFDDTFEVGTHEINEAASNNHFKFNNQSTDLYLVRLRN